MSVSGVKELAIKDGLTEVKVRLCSLARRGLKRLVLAGETPSSVKLTGAFTADAVHGISVLNHRWDRQRRGTLRRCGGKPKKRTDNSIGREPPDQVVKKDEISPTLQSVEMRMNDPTTVRILKIVGDNGRSIPFRVQELDTGHIQITFRASKRVNVKYSSSTEHNPKNPLTITISQ